MIVESEALNDVQQAAVEHTDGPCLIFAGAGSGKTRVLTNRIAYLLNEKKVFPDRILALTFTNKAAGEMKSRIEAMVGAPARDLWIGTFHAMCVRMLRRDGKKIGIASNFAIMDDTDQKQIIRDILHDLDMDERQVIPGAALAEISKAKNNLWSPDVYQGAPTPVTALLAVASKAAGFIVLLTLMTQAFGPYEWLVLPVLTFMAAGTILFGNLAALKQHNVKRLIGLSGVSHAGFLLLAVVSVPRVSMAVGAIYFYLFAYLIASFSVFGVMTVLAGHDDAEQELGSFSGLSRESPFLAGVLACGLGSLAGIPPLAGFMGKLFVFVAAFKAGHYGLLAVAIAGVVISIYYYFGWIRAAFFNDEPAASPEMARRVRVGGGFALNLVLGLLAAATIILGFYQGPLGAWVSWR